MIKLKRKTTANAISLLMMFAMVISLIALQNANAQSDLIMNLPGSEGVIDEVLIHSEVDIDLNGGPGPNENVSLFVKYPGRTSFTYIDSYLTRSNGDLDVYDFDFNETGDFELKWALPPDFTEESNVETARVVSEILVTTYPFLGAIPNPVGVGQEVLLHIGITQQLSSAEQGWEGLTVKVTRPDGQTETLGPFKTDSTGGTGAQYVPTMAGNYTLQTIFPEQICEEGVGGFFGGGVPEGATMEHSESAVLTLVVTEEPIEYYPDHPLPTEYWTRPIDAHNRAWGAIAGSSWMDPEYNDLPESAHILWKKPFTFGGVAGGETGEHAFECGDAYEGKWDDRLILAGRLYYDVYAEPEQYHKWVCVDMHTGEEIWSKTFPDNDTIDMGQMLYWDTYDYHGVYDYLWTSDSDGWHAWDAYTGDWVYTMDDVPSGSTIYGPKGEILRYSVSLSRGYMTLWNSSAIPRIRSSTQYNSMGWGQWRPYGKTIDADAPCGVTPETPLGISGYSWNITIPSGLSGSVREVIIGDKVVGSDEGFDTMRVWAFSLKPGQEGQLLYDNSAKYSIDTPSKGSGPRSVEDGVFVQWDSELYKYWGFSFTTGELLWESDHHESYLNHYDHDHMIAYGMLYSTGVSGITCCYNVTTGELLWEYHAADPYSEILWANDWWTEILWASGGKIYLGHEEHSPIDPKPRGAPFICLNATTGEEIWRINGAFRQTHWGGKAIMGESMIVTQDTYDQCVYAIGKGPSAMTAAASPKISVHGSNVLVEGMVTDISPGTAEFARTVRFPNGVPAVSDANMSDWMLYVYKQFPRPTDVVGVEVVIEVLDPNNNYYEVGRATSDASGFFSYMFAPEVPGKYTVVATFAGSRSYYGSFAETAFGVEEAPAASPEPTPTPASASDLYLVPGIAGIIVAIVVVGAILMLMLRKR